MEKLTFDTGVKEYEINGRATLRFNPSDPNVYARLMKASDEIHSIETEYLNKVKSARDTEDKHAFTIAVTQMLEELDSNVKDILSKVFGQNNDFHKIFDGVNIVALRRDGKTRVLDAFFEAVTPILEDGLKEIFAKDDAMIQKYTAEYE